MAILGVDISSFIMRVVIQRVSRAQVSVGGDGVGAIGKGLLLFLGVGRDDTEADADWLVKRIVKIRLFESSPGRMDLALPDIEGEALAISQFTLFGSLKKGNRPSFNRAAPPEEAKRLYEYFVDRLSSALARPVPTGEFGAEMEIEAHNHGPVTLLVDSKSREF